MNQEGMFEKVNWKELTPNKVTLAVFANNKITLHKRLLLQ